MNGGGRVGKKHIVLGVVVLALAGAAAKFYWPTSAPQARSPVQTVTTAVVRKQDMPVQYEVAGNTVAASVVDIRPQITSVVSAVPVREGQMVSKGDLLFALDDRADRANYEKAQAAADDAARQLQRAQELVKQQFIAQSALDTAQSNAQAASAAARAAQATLSYSSIRAPISGRIGIINVFPGSLVAPGNVVTTSTTATATTTQGAMATVTQMDPINVQFTIAESMLPAFFEAQRQGQNLSIEFESGARSYVGKIYVIDNQVDVAIGAVRAKAVVPNPEQRLIPGQFVQLKVKAGEFKDALVIPSQAVVLTQRGSQAYVVGADDTVALQPIKVLSQISGMAVISGLNEGDRVVVEGKQNLRPKAKVRESDEAGGAKKATDKPADKAGETPAAASHK